MKVMGILFGNVGGDDLPQLTSVRTLASVPFGGRYRLIDFALSNMVNSGVFKVGVIIRENYQSLMTHIGSGKSWDLSRKNGGILFLPPFGERSNRSFYATRYEALRNNVAFLKNSVEDYVILSDCDKICNMDFGEALERHIARHADVTLLYRVKSIPNGYNKEKVALTVAADGRVTEVTISPKLKGEQNLFADVTVVGRKFLLELLENSDEFGYSRFYSDFLKRGCRNHNIFAVRYNGYFASIDSLSDYYKHSMELLDRNVCGKLFDNNGASIFTKVRDSSPCRFGDEAIAGNCIISDGCVIEGEVYNSILFRGVKVDKGAKVYNSILFQNVEVGADTHLNCVIADKNAFIGESRLLSGHETQPYFISKGTVV